MEELAPRMHPDPPGACPSRGVRLYPPVPGAFSQSMTPDPPPPIPPETPTPAAVPPPLPRLLAWAVDCTAVLLWAGVLVAVVLGWPATTLAPGVPLGAAEGHFVSFLTLTLPALLYFALFESSAWRGTPGKRLLNLQVEGVGGGRLPLERALLRGAVRLLPWEVAHFALWRIPGWPAEATGVPLVSAMALLGVWFLVGLYLWTLLAASDGRALWDHLASSRVITRPARE